MTIAAKQGVLASVFVLLAIINAMVLPEGIGMTIALTGGAIANAIFSLTGELTDITIVLKADKPEVDQS